MILISFQLQPYVLFVSDNFPIYEMLFSKLYTFTTPYYPQITQFNTNMNIS